MRTIATLVIAALLVITTIGFVNDRHVRCVVYEKDQGRVNTPIQVLSISDVGLIDEIGLGCLWCVPHDETDYP